MAARAFGGAGGAGGLLNASTPGKQLVALLESDASRYTWIAATTGANSAAGYQLATDDPVMAIGGFNGTDPSPTLAQFQKYVAEGKIHYYISGGGAAVSSRRQLVDLALVGHRHLGELALHRQDRGRCDRLRPDGAQVSPPPARAAPGEAPAAVGGTAPYRGRPT